MFKYMSVEQRLVKEAKKQESLEARQNEADLVNSITFVKLAENGMLDDVTATEHVDMFLPWSNGASYLVGDYRQYEGKLYKCIQSHTSQEDWAPHKAPTLWAIIGDPNEEYPQWAQPIGAYDAYNQGDKVTHLERKWISTADGNVWEPGVYGWIAEDDA
ncbi:MAG: alpha-amylase [Clostridia bacterium]|nr:alpha-amylase [Clostridia bacterium]